MAGDLRVMVSAAQVLAGEWGAQGMAVLGVLTILSLGNAGVLASSRFPFAMSRDKLVPSIFGRIHPKYMTPMVSIVTTGAMMAVLIVTFDIVKIAKLASSLKIFIFMVVLVIVSDGTTWYEPKFRALLS